MLETKKKEKKREELGNLFECVIRPMPSTANASN